MWATLVVFVGWKKGCKDQMAEVGRAAGARVVGEEEGVDVWYDFRLSWCTSFPLFNPLLPPYYTSLYNNTESMTVYCLYLLT